MTFLPFVRDSKLPDKVPGAPAPVPAKAAGAAPVSAPAPAPAQAVQAAPGTAAVASGPGADIVAAITAKGDEIRVLKAAKVGLAIDPDFDWPCLLI